MLAEREKRSVRRLVTIGVATLLVVLALGLVAHVLSLALSSSRSESHALGERFELKGTASSGTNPIAGSWRDTLSWDGTLAVTVDSVAIYDSPQQAGLDPGQHAEADWQREGIVVVDVTIENVSAVSSSGSPEHPSWFHSGFLRLFDAADQDSGEAWFSGTPADALLNEGLYFDLAPGQVASYRIGYLVDRKHMDEPYRICIGKNASTDLVDSFLGDSWGSCDVDLGVLGHA